MLLIKVYWGGSEREATYPFYLVDSYETGTRKELRRLFDQNIRLCDFCNDNYDETLLYTNMTFDLQNEIRGLEYRYDLIDKIDRLVVMKNGPYFQITGEVSMDGNLSLKKTHDIVEKLEEKLRKYDSRAKYINIHVNPTEK